MPMALKVDDVGGLRSLKVEEVALPELASGPVEVSHQLNVGAVEELVHGERLSRRDGEGVDLDGRAKLAEVSDEDG
jgi:hypothetical protein